MADFELESSPIWMDVRSVIESGSKPVRFEYRGQIHTESQDFNVVKITAVDMIRDYANNIGEHLQVKIKIPLGDYLSKLYPFRTNLEMSIKRIELADGGTGREKDSKIQLRRYKVVFAPEKNPALTGSQLEQYDNESLNNMQMLDIRLDLYDRSLEPLRIKTTSGCYTGLTPKKIIMSVLGSEASKILIDGKPCIDGVDVVDPDNEEVQKSLMIPDSTLVTSFPTFMHEKKCGVYSTGIGTFLQYYDNRHILFVFPLYNTKRYDTTKGNKLIVYAIPEGKLPSLDRSYFMDGQVLKVVATSARSYSDDADVDFMNKGSGFRMADARAFMAKPVQITPEGPKANRTRLNFEVAAEERKDGLNYAPNTSGIPSSNPFPQYSRIAGMQLGRQEFIWENADPELIYPGMPCSYVYLDNNKVIELKGTVQYTHTLTTLQGDGITGNLYRNVTTVIMMVTQVTADQKFKNRKIPNQAEIGDF